MINRVKEIKKKGFAMHLETDTPQQPINLNNNVIDFSKIKVGIKTLEDATYIIGDLKQANSSYADKQTVLEAIDSANYEQMRSISNFFYKTSGIYNRLCRYLAYMYRYDWMITPYIISENMKSEKVLSTFTKALAYLDNFKVKKFFGEVALKVIRNGCYYGYLIPQKERMTIQELPINYCRSRFTAEDGRPVVEFNVKYFDDAFRDANQKMKILKIFPDEIKKGYLLYKEGKLKPDFLGDTAGWYLLSPENVIKFNINGDDFPTLISVIPAIIDLDDAQALDKKKLQQQLLKIIIQKMPVDKNGDLVFDVDEAQQLHNNVVKMLGKAIGVDVLTTFADVDVADMSSTGNTTATDDGMDRVKSAIYDQAGISQMQFNTNGNLALEKSIANDEASMYNLIQQFEDFLNLLLKSFNKNPNKMYFKAQILSTTIYNYKELAKMYKEQTQLGYSKMLPQIALGQSQSSVLANAFFENDILDLVNVFIPPMSSNTMSVDVLNNLGSQKAGNQDTGTDNVGRPEKPDDEKSEKTIQNRESMT